MSSTRIVRRALAILALALAIVRGAPTCPCSTARLEANLKANGNKITNLATATISGDALGYGQIASGDLSGALPNATVQTVLNGKVPVFAGHRSAGPDFRSAVRRRLDGWRSGSEDRHDQQTCRRPAGRYA
jgi:hypothetical protein